MASPKTPAKPGFLHVWSNRESETDTYVVLPPDGAALPIDEAKALLERGLVTTKDPEGSDEK